MVDIDKLRSEIDQIDTELIRVLSKRFEFVEEIAKYKKENNMSSLQPKRWQEVLDMRKAQATELGIEPEMIDEIWNIIHEFAIKKQNSILKKD